MTDLWDLSPVSSPAATDRIGAATGPGAGGYLPLGNLVWRGTGSFFLAKSTGELLRLETTTTRGSGSNYVGFSDPDGSKGFVGYGGGDDTFFVENSMSSNMRIASGGFVDLRSNGVLSARATDIDVRPGNDNGKTLGNGSARWSTVFAVTGSINTSDGTEKTPLRGFTPAELSAAKRIAATVGVFQFLSSIAEKGAEGARLHCGVIAQDVWAIMADENLIDPVAEGVDPDSRYAFLCWDKWGATEAVTEVRDHEGRILVDAEPARPAGQRFGIRSDQLALFLIAAQEARLASIEAAL